MTTPADYISNWKTAAAWTSLVTIDPRLLALYNKAYGKVFDLQDWEWKKREATITTTTASSYTIAADFRWPQPKPASIIKTSTGGQIYFCNDTDWFRRDRSVSSGTPTDWRIAWSGSLNPKIELYPTPTAGIVIYFPYVITVSALASNGTLAMPHSHLRVAEDLFYYYAFTEFNRNGQYKDRIKSYGDDAIRGMRTLLSEDRSKAVDAPHDVYGDVCDQQFIYDGGDLWLMI